MKKAGRSVAARDFPRLRLIVNCTSCAGAADAVLRCAICCGFGPSRTARVARGQTTRWAVRGLLRLRPTRARFCSGFGPAHRGFGPAHRIALVVPQHKLRSFCYCGLGHARRPIGRTSTWRSPENAFRTLWGLFLVCMFGPPAVRTTACDASFGTAEGRNTAQRRQWSC